MFNKLAYLYPATDALAVEVIFVDFSHLVFIADLSGLRVLARPVETLLQTTDLLGLQENLPLEILTVRSNEAEGHPSSSVVNVVRGRQYEAVE